MARPAPRTYEIRTVFRAPRAFAFRGCTDYTSRDPALEGSKGQRHVIDRTKRRVVYEDLEPIGKAWSWSRNTVDLLPPDRWHAEARGNYRTWSLDYELTALGPMRTGLRLRGRRTPVGLGTKNPSQRAMTRELTQMWRKFGRALEADYRRSVRSSSGRRSRRRSP